MAPMWEELLATQHGVIARWQAPGAGLGTQVIDARLRRHRWQPLYRGVYAAFTGPLPRPAILWAGLLRVGPDAVLSHYTAAELDGLTEQASAAVHVTAGADRKTVIGPRERGESLPALVVHRSSRLDQARHPARIPPRTRIEETVLDLTQVSDDFNGAFAWLSCACGRRLTTPQRLRDGMARRAVLRWRAELTEALADIEDGVQSSLERRYVRDVERPHGLPAAQRQATVRLAHGNRYLDNYYRGYAVAVELDGRAAHPVEARWRDIHRDNAHHAAGIVTLRYSWADVTGDPCRVAAEVARVLAAHGWTGQLRACGPGCRARTS